MSDISDLTGFPEMLDGRVKTLHPNVHGGLLYIRGNAEHEAAVAAHGIQPIDMVVVNLYAFEKTAAQPGVAFGHLIENIDIGGPSMVRSAAKNFEDVAIVTARRRLPRPDRGTERQQRRAHAAKPAGAWPSRPSPPPPPTTPPSPTPSSRSPRAPARQPSRRLRTTARASRNAAHQLCPWPSPCATAKIPTSAPPSIATAPAWASPAPRSCRARSSASTTSSISTPAGNSRRNSTSPPVTIVKHTNPCGAATGRNLLEAYQKALAADPVSAFGGVIGINREVDGDAAEEIAKLFVEAIAAPAFTPEARERFAAKKNLRLVEVRPAPPRAGRQARLRRLAAAGRRHRPLTEADLKVVTWRPPTAEETAQPALRLARRASTSNRTPSSTRATARPSASAPDR